LMLLLCQMTTAGMNCLGLSAVSAAAGGDTVASCRSRVPFLATPCRTTPGDTGMSLLFGPVWKFRLDLIESPPPTIRTVAHILPRMVARTGDVSDLADARHPMAHHHISLSQFHRSA